MPMIYPPAAACICVAAGIILHAGWLSVCLKRRGSKAGFHGLELLLPGALAILCAKGGYELLQTGESYAMFRWCYTTGLVGLSIGTGLAARFRGYPGSRTRGSHGALRDGKCRKRPDQPRGGIPLRVPGIRKEPEPGDGSL